MFAFEIYAHDRKALDKTINHLTRSSTRLPADLGSQVLGTGGTCTLCPSPVTFSTRYQHSIRWKNSLHQSTKLVLATNQTLLLLISLLVSASAAAKDTNTQTQTNTGTMTLISMRAHSRDVVGVCISASCQFEHPDGWWLLAVGNGIVARIVFCLYLLRDKESDRRMTTNMDLARLRPCRRRRRRLCKPLQMDWSTQLSPSLRDASSGF